MAQTTYATDPYNLTATPQSGSGAYGSVPGAIGIPSDTWNQVGSIYPGLSDQAGQMSSNINNELMGQLSPETIASLQQHAAQFGISSGMPGSQFQGNQGLTQLGLNVEGVQRQGQQDYLSALAGIGATQTPQSLAADIANRNATLASAPNPQQAAAQQMQDWMTKFNATAGAGAGGGSRNPAGGTGAYAPTGGGAPQQQGPYSGSGPFSPAPTGGGTPVGAGGYYNLPTGNTTGGGANNWSDIGGGMYMNINTGEIYDSQTGQQYSGYDPGAGTTSQPADTYTGGGLSYYDPTGTMGAFDTGAAYTPPNTYSTDTSSTYDPFGTAGAFDTSGGAGGYDYSMFSPDTGGYYSDYTGG